MMKPMIGAKARAMGIILSALSMFAVCCWAADGDRATITRGDLVEHCKARIALTSSEAFGSKADREKMLNDLRQELAEIAVRVLPEKMNARNAETLREILKTNMTLTRVDRAYNLLKMEEWLRLLRVEMVVSCSTPEVPEGQKRALEKNVKQLSEGVTRSMKLHLAEFFSADEIDSQVQEATAKWRAKIGYALSEELRIPISEEAVSTLVADYDDRVKESAGRTRSRLAQLPLPGEDRNQTAKREKKLKDMMLMEIVLGPFLVLSTRTRDPLVSEPDIAKIDPVLVDVRSKLRAREAELNQAKQAPPQKPAPGN